MIVVTGGAGHLGNNLIRRLLAQGETVRCLVLPGEDLRSLDGLEVQRVEGDVRDLDSLLRAFAGADVAYHMASVIALIPGRTKLLQAVNVDGTRNVVEACLRCNVRRLVYTSSIHALVEPAPGTVIDETMPCDPARIPLEYSKSKAAATLEVLAGVRRGLDAVILSPTGIIGPYDFRPSEMGRLFVSFSQGRMRAYVDGAYDFVDCRDVVAGHLAAAARGRTGENYILSGELVTVRQLLSQLAEVTGRPAPRLRLPWWAASAAAALATGYSRLTGTATLLSWDALYTLRSNSLVSHAKASRELGYRPRPLRESIADTVRWLQTADMC